MMNIRRYSWMAVLCCLLFGGKVLAQPQLFVDKKVYEFGSVKWREPVSGSFTLTNKGDKPLVISHVSTSCGCTVAAWTKEPILPGKAGTVTATFDAATLGHFDKRVGVYCNASDVPVYLRIRGDVVSEIKDYSGTYPVTVGALRLDKDTLLFPGVRPGGNSVVELHIVNSAKSRYTPVVMQLPSFMTVESRTIMGGRKGTLRFIVNGDKLPQLGVTETTVYISRFQGDKVGEDNALHVRTVLLPAPATGSALPHLEVSDTLINLGRVKKSKTQYKVKVKNTGSGELHIEKIQLFSPALTVNLEEKNIQPGKESELKLTVLKEFLKKKNHLEVLLLTDDPVRPIVKLRIEVKK